MREEICGTCKWHQLEDEESGYVCTNPDSDNRADWTEYEDSCEEWEEKE